MNAARTNWADGRNAGNDRHHDSFHPDPRDIIKAEVVIRDALENGGATITRGYEPVDLDGKWSVGGFYDERSYPVQTISLSSWASALDDLATGVVLDRYHEPASADGRNNGDESPTYYTVVTDEEVTRLATLLHKYIVSSPTFIWQGHIGLWVDEGRIYFDVVRLFDDHLDAKLEGAKRQQVSIYNGTTGEVEWIAYAAQGSFQAGYHLVADDADGLHIVPPTTAQSYSARREHLEGAYAIVRPFTADERKEYGHTHLVQRWTGGARDVKDAAIQLYYAVTFK